jgi:acetyl-CoA C-acetyltransferase
VIVAPRTPVLVGAGEITHRDNDDIDPIVLAVEASCRAFDDTGAGEVNRRIDTVATPGILLIRRDHPATRIADALGLDARRRISCPVGGNTPQYLVEVLGHDIRSGSIDAALVVGAESGASARRQRSGQSLPEPPPVERPDESLGDARPGLSPAEHAAGLWWPHEVYPVFESAIAARAGRTLDDQRAWLGRMMAPFTEEAARHPDQAWFPMARTPDELSTETTANRMVCEPYTKLLNSILTVDMAAAFILMAAEVADDLGIGRDRWVFPWAAATCNDVYFPVQRPELGISPGIRAAGDAVLRAGDVSTDDLAWFDLYSCFPAAVEAAADALDLDPFDPRGLTVTGGLPYHGGPGNNYVTHSIVAMARRCREQTGGIGLVSGLGWYITKHSLGLWSASPPPHGFQTPDMSAAQASIDATAIEVAAPDEASGTAAIEGYTVVHDRQRGPAEVPVFARLRDGRRVAARSTDPDVARAMSGGQHVGEPIELRAGAESVEFALS